MNECWWLHCGYTIQYDPQTFMVSSDRHPTSPAENNRLIILWLNLWLYMMNVSAPGGGCPFEDSLSRRTLVYPHCWGDGPWRRLCLNVMTKSLLQLTVSSLYMQYTFTVRNHLNDDSGFVPNDCFKCLDRICIHANVWPLSVYHVRYVIDQPKLSAAFWQPSIELLRPACIWLITSRGQPATIDLFNFAYLLLLGS